jgi:hypothetical protein
VKKVIQNSFRNFTIGKCCFLYIVIQNTNEVDNFCYREMRLNAATLSVREMKIVFISITTFDIVHFAIVDDFNLKTCGFNAPKCFYIFRIYN